jgi:hypothetical protein
VNLSRLLRNNWDRALAIVAVLGGLLAILLGWRGVSDATLATEQLPYIASGIGLGLFLLGVAGTLWLSAELRDAWRKLGDVHRVLTGADDEYDDEPAPALVANGSNGHEAASRRRAGALHASDR